MVTTGWGDRVLACITFVIVSLSGAPNPLPCIFHIPGALTDISYPNPWPNRESQSLSRTHGPLLKPDFKKRQRIPSPKAKWTMQLSIYTRRAFPLTNHLYAFNRWIDLAVTRFADEVPFILVPSDNPHFWRRWWAKEHHHNASWLAVVARWHLSDK